jgi:Leu/Phe-tRNA-protein transferase
VRIRQTLDERVPNEKDKTELISDYITSGMLAAYQAWFNSSRARSLEDYSKDVSVLVMSGINGLLGTH